MGVTKIEWTNFSWNPWIGCTRISAGCLNCYMFDQRSRFRHKPDEVIKTSKHTFTAPLRWRSPAMVFTCSWSDFFHPEVRQEWRQEAWAIIQKCPHLIFQILTKRPENILPYLPDDWGEGWKNVWLGVTAENQQAAAERMPLLLSVPSQTRFVSCEPLLGPVDLRPWLHQIDWVIIGGESGHNARPMDINWVRSLITQCRLYDVPVFVKQLGSVWAREAKSTSKKGNNIDEWPEDLRIRMFPEPANKVGGQHQGDNIFTPCPPVTERSN